MKIFLFILLVIVIVPFILVLVGAFLPSKEVATYERALKKLPPTDQDEGTKD